MTLVDAGGGRPRKDRWERLRTGLSQVLAVLALLLACGVQSRWQDLRPGVAGLLYGAGLLLVAVASGGRSWCSLYVSGRKDAQLTTDGPYSLCRNPLYLFSAIGAIGVGLCTRTLTAPLLLIALFALYYPGIIRREEGRLSVLFGEDYRRYCASTPRFFPSARGWREPETWQVNPRRFRRHLVDDAMFIWVAALLAVIEGLQGRWLPHLWALW